MTISAALPLEASPACRFCHEVYSTPLYQISAKSDNSQLNYCVLLTVVVVLHHEVPFLASVLILLFIQ